MQGVRPWPKGLVLKSIEFESLESELYHYLTQKGGGEYKIQKIDAFITELLDGDLTVLHQLNLPDVRSARKSFLRYLTNDSRFKIYGPSRTRMISISDAEYGHYPRELIHDEQILVDELKIRILTTKPKSKGLLRTDLESYGYQSRMIEQLLEEDRIMENDSYISLGPKGLIGCSITAKKASSVSMPTSSWDKLNHIKKVLNDNIYEPPKIDSATLEEVLEQLNKNPEQMSKKGWLSEKIAEAIEEKIASARSDLMLKNERGDTYIHYLNNVLNRNSGFNQSEVAEICLDIVGLILGDVLSSKSPPTDVKTEKSTKIV